MKLDINEIAGVLKQRISQYKNKLDISTVGRVVEAGDGTARIYGLDNARAGEILEFENDVFGEVFNLEEDSIGAIIYGEYTKVKEGSDVRPTGRLMSIPVGFELLGRVVDPLGRSIDGGPAIKATATRTIESECRNSRTSAGQPALANRVKMHRLNDTHRPRAARAYYRRPQNRQNGPCPRYHNKPERK